MKLHEIASFTDDISAAVKNFVKQREAICLLNNREGKNLANIKRIAFLAFQFQRCF